ncbi:MAG: glycosyltransferase, partial [Alphaproteobacteria bacterium]
IRERPWDWQGWIDVHALLGAPADGAATGRGATAVAASPIAPASSAPAAVGEADGAGPASVILIHDAADDVLRCVESVLAHAPADASVVLVDDASRDAGLRGWLDGLPDRDSRVTLLRNADNRGFVASANRGIAAAAGRDVLFLNSDTMVPPGFVERLRDAVRATPATGIVTPFTNSGEIFTLPGLLDGPGAPSPGQLARVDATVAATSPLERPLVPTGHGFCLWIRADVLRRVGAFDEAAFGRGYGEENDLCERAIAAGFEVRLCDDLFVWHRGGASFGAERDGLVASHLDLLEQRHPGYRERIRAFVERDPLASHRERVRLHRSRARAGRPRAMLFVLHADPFVDPRRENIGGTQYHVLDLVRGLALPRALVAWPDPAGTAVAEVENGDLDGARTQRFAHRRPAGGVAASRFTLREPAWEAAIGRLVDALDVGAVHVHHLAFWPVGLHRELAARGIPWSCTVQDYHCVCPSWNLLDLSTAERCGCTGDPDAKLRCLRAWYGACGLDVPGDLEAMLREHRSEFARLLRGAHAVVAGCETTRRIVEHAFPDEAWRWHVLPYGYDRSPPPTVARAPGPLRVALLGAVAAPWKGSGQVLRTMEMLRDLRVEWHVFGDSDAHGFPALARDAAGGHERVVFHGRYRREEIVARLVDARADASLLLSPWDETFCYTLSESWAAGVPAIVSDRGALAERMRATGGGAVAADPTEAAALLRRAAGDPALLSAWRRAASSHAEPTVADNAARHRDIWGEVLARLRTAGPGSDPDRP